MQSIFFYSTETRLSPFLLFAQAHAFRNRNQAVLYIKFLCYIFARGNDVQSFFQNFVICTQPTRCRVCFDGVIILQISCEMISKWFVFLLYVYIDRQCGPERSTDHTPSAQHRATTSTCQLPQPHHNLTFLLMTASSFSIICHWQGS